MKNTLYQPNLQFLKDKQEQIREVVTCQMRSAALEMAKNLFDEELDLLCGPKHSRKGTNACHRTGSDPGSIIFQGQRVAIKKPRVKQDGGEQQLQTYSALQNYDLLCERVISHMLSGVSTRDYERLLDDVAGGVGLKKSSVSKAFVKASKAVLEEVNDRDLSEHKFISIMIDGIGFGERTIVAALGIAKNGKKCLLGIREGDTENWELCKDLFENLIGRGLCIGHEILFVIDGSKALKKAIKKVFGKLAFIQRCIRHKERNIIKYLPKERHNEFYRRWKKLHGLNDYALAEKEYKELFTWLENISDACSNSLAEAEMDTLTVIKLKVSPLLKKTLLSTNPLESMFSVVAAKKARVKNWRSSKDQASRWAAATGLDAEKRSHRVAGCLHLEKLTKEMEKIKLEKIKNVA